MREDVAKLLEQKKFIEAEKTLQKFLYTSSQYNDEEEVLWQNLITVQRQNNSKDIIKTYQYYLERIVSSGNKHKLEKSLQILEQLLQLAPLDLEQSKIYFASLWNDGQVEKYHNEVEKFLDNLIISKNIPALKKIVPEIIQTNQLWPKPQICLLMMYQFCNDVDSAINTASLFLDAIEKKWRLLNRKKLTAEQYFIRVLNILEQFESNHSSLHCYKLKLRNKIFLKFNNTQFRLTKREIIELIIADYANIDSLLLSLASLKSYEDENVSELVKVIKEHSKFSVRYVTQNFPELFDLFSQSISVVYRPVKASRSASDTEKLEVNSSFLASSAKSKNQEYERSAPYVCSIEEKEVIAQIQAGEFEKNTNINDLALAFKGLGYFEAAICLLKTNFMTKERLYILCEIMFDLKRFVDVIAEINDSIVQGLFEGELPIEFKYLEAESYLKIGNTHKARKIYREIMLENPDYRQVRARYRNA